MSLETSNICLCYITPATWNSSLSSFLAFASLCIILIQFVYFGILFGTRNKLIFFMNILVFYLLYYLLWRLQSLIAWPRPVTSIGGCTTSACQNSWFYSLLNQYGFPDPLFITGFAFGFIYIYTEWRIFGRLFPTLLFFILFAYLIVFSIAEIGLSRMNAGQYSSNLLLTIVFIILLFIFAKYFFEAFPIYKGERNRARMVEEINRAEEEEENRNLIGTTNLDDPLYGFAPF